MVCGRWESERFYILVVKNLFLGSFGKEWHLTQHYQASGVAVVLNTTSHLFRFCLRKLFSVLLNFNIKYMYVTGVPSM